MKLPFSFGKKEIKNYFLALLFQDEKIGAVVFEEVAGKIHVVSRSEEHFATSLEEAEFEEWLDIVDKAVSIAEESLPGGIQTQKTVFGVKQEWILDGKIKKEYLSKLKRICDELELQPIGFLVFTEAIIHLLQKEEGAPVSAILVEIGKKFIDLSIIRAGRIVAVKQIKFTSPVPHAIDEALKHFSDIEIFPSRIILFDSQYNERLSQSFISHSWSKSLPFLHMPQITILPPGFDTKGILFGTATQMGFEVAQHDLQIPIKTHPSPEEKQEFVKEELLEENKEQEKTADAVYDTLGKEEEPEKYKINDIHTREHHEVMISENASADYFGFVKNKDITGTPHNKQHEEKETYEKNIPSRVISQAIEEIPEEVKEEETEMNKPGGLPVQGMLLFEGIKKGLAKISFKGLFQKNHRTFSLASQTTRESRQKKPLGKTILIISVIVLICISAVIWYATSLSAIVTLSITPKPLEDKKTVSFAVGGSSDFNNNIIAAEDAQIQENGTLSADSTGTKEVGTQAKGNVTIFSRLTSTTNISKGTVFTSSNNLAFTLDSSVTVASFSGDTSDPSVTVSNVSLTAKNIGPDSNIPSGTKFSINGLSTSDISAKNDSPFTGGTKKDITVVSQKDLDTLLDTLTKNLSDKAKNDMNANQNTDKVLLPFFTKQEATKKTFSKNAGDEAKSVSLDATIVFHGASYNKNDLISFAKEVFKDNITSESELAKDSLQTDIGDVKQDKNTISATLDVKASLIPKLDTTTLARNITGKSFSSAETVLKENSQIAGVNIRLKPNIPFLPKFLPRLSKNIQIITSTNE